MVTACCQCRRPLGALVIIVEGSPLCTVCWWEHHRKSVEESKRRTR